MFICRSGTATGAMERDLHARDRVGVQDFVLLENFQDESAFVDNLRKRFKENLIYVSIIDKELTDKQMYRKKCAFLKINCNKVGK